MALYSAIQLACLYFQMCYVKIHYHIINYYFSVSFLHSHGSDSSTSCIFTISCGTLICLVGQLQGYSTT